MWHFSWRFDCRKCIFYFVWIVFVEAVNDCLQAKINTTELEDPIVPKSLIANFQYLTQVDVNVTLKWAYINQTSPEGNIWLCLQLSEFENDLMCQCQFANATSFQQKRKLIKGACTEHHAKAKFTIESNWKKTWNVSVPNCWEAMGDDATSVCREKMPPPPTNVNAWGKKYDKVVVSWTAPQNSTMSNQDYCVIESRSENSNQKIFGCFNCSTMIINSTYDLVGVKVCAAVKVSKDSNDKRTSCSLIYTVDNFILVCSHSVYSEIRWITPEPNKAKSIDVHYVVWPIIGILLLLIFLTLGSVLVKRHCRKGRVPIPVVLTWNSAFVVASTNEDSEMNQKIRQLCHSLDQSDIIPVYYEYERYKQDSSSPAALGLNRWVSRQLTESPFVIFVCTDRFIAEWKDESNDAVAPLVSTVRHFFDSECPSRQNMRRFIVLLTTKLDSITSRLQYLKVLEGAFWETRNLRELKDYLTSNT